MVQDLTQVFKQNIIGTTSRQRLNLSLRPKPRPSLNNCTPRPSPNNSTSRSNISTSTVIQRFQTIGYFISTDTSSLSQIECSKIRIGRHSNNMMTARQLSIGQTIALITKHNRHFIALSQTTQLRCDHSYRHRLQLSLLTRCGANSNCNISKSLFKAFKQFAIFQNIYSIHSHTPGF